MLDNAHLDKFLVTEVEWCLQLVNYSYISRQKIITSKHGKYVYASPPEYRTKSTYSQNPTRRQAPTKSVKSNTVVRFTATLVMPPQTAVNKQWHCIGG